MSTDVTRVDFYRHALQPADIEQATAVLNTLFLTTGPIAKQVEAKLAAYLGQKHAVLVNSCTTGLFLSLKALEIGPGDEVITTPMTFIASANVILHAGATPVLVDVEPTTGNIDLNQVKDAITEKTKAIIPVHLYGQMVDIKGLQELCEPRGIAIVEDAAHALEATRDGAKPGQLGTMANFSFYATKNLTCGEGGAISTDDDHLYDQLQKLRLHGMSKSAADRYTSRYQHWDMELLGYKANLPDILAALLLHQIDRLEDQLKSREAIAQQYNQGLDGIAGLARPQVLANSRTARHLYTIWAPREHRDETLAKLQDRGIGVAVNFRAIHLLKYYRETFGFEPGAFPVAEEIGDRTITLPLYTTLPSESIDYVCSALRDIAAGW